jgi:hypothetical protein
MFEENDNTEIGGGGGGARLDGNEEHISEVRKTRWRLERKGNV